MKADFKRAIAMVCFVCLCLSLCACGTQQSPSAETKESAEVTEQTTPEAEAAAEEETTPEEPAAEEETESEAPAAQLFDASALTPEELTAQIVSQDNRHGLHSFVMDDLWVYGTRPGSSGAGEVFKMRRDWSDWTVLDSFTGYALAKCLAVEEGWLYYCQYATAEAENMELVKMRVSGGDAQVIVEELFGDTQFVDGFIYYTSAESWNEDYTAVTDESTHLYRCDLNGENVELILDKPVYYFTVFGDRILYQDDHDGCSLHLYSMAGGTDEKLNDVGSYWPIYDGEYIYYLADEEGTMDPEGYTLWRMMPDGSGNEAVGLDCHLAALSLRGEYAYFTNSDDDHRLYRCRKADGKGLELITQDSNVLYFQWLGDHLVYMKIDGNGYIDGVYFCLSDGSGKSEF